MLCNAAVIIFTTDCERIDDDVKLRVMLNSRQLNLFYLAFLFVLFFTLYLLRVNPERRERCSCFLGTLTLYCRVSVLLFFSHKKSFWLKIICHSAN